MILFNEPLVTGKENYYISQVLKNKKFCGDGIYTKKCNQWIEENTKTKKALLTTSCTHAIEMAAILADIQKGDEVIMPSYTFVSSANPFVLRGARIVFVDIRPDTMNIDETKIEEAITPRTKAIVPVHYAGVGCDMDAVMNIAKKHNLIVIEDAAQGIMSSYNWTALGSIGHIGCFSFHETKNYQCGEGGAILVNDPKFMEQAEIIREKGTNRTKFLRGQIDKYTWVDIGSSYLPSEINAAFLFAQLEMSEEVNIKRHQLWNRYYKNLKDLEIKGFLELPTIPHHCRHNAHMFYLKLADMEKRHELIGYLRSNEIQSAFHYIPLHTAKAGYQFGTFVGEDKYTTRDSERILRLPMHYDLSMDNIDFICERIQCFFGNK
ncbi:MAG: dTDP-4-amino-4,6-dideoxygalactose transaminase [Candidatus Margulisiibacteriota bacterium]|nr:MAG: dTDP-4-amino-4,6-dideoxygalactose transaminase [Candidatus Margulisbacteria bacterium GWD2_39_127]OGI04419.1 MAG: dTDP-4-amino-4,6-dideoxygalactose transaminase [Candidatus Margulisbacteria bacterium GWF2_38_17]OGI07859.1 MAG: dTDP-4-amino-4,6-dideoxygalactose transaminase [Candidatus Margulisbacteria bacterium GWE2_39_32]PZM80085.1 MAG: dTDP-4-amino-4,6-dideoxygalactose transaminase [Candidatus Margulisiibacteriota bacterium]HAR62651.1 dTDP-4-amino-4,6-dideoxygalactose transaminase [Ca